MSERLQQQPHELIDRSQPIQFRFEGRPCTGFAGDTISSALWAQGVRLMGRSFKYHRPRGIYSLANHDANVMVEDGQRTNMRGDVTPIAPDMAVHAVNTLGGVNRDLLKVTGLFSKFLPVGFYYKAFHTPRKLFPFYERRMRKVAGLGRINPKAQAQVTPKRYDFCDLLVIGAGPAGLAGAIEAAQKGLRVIVVDEQASPGGTLTYQWASVPSVAEQLAQVLATAGSLDNLELRMGTQAAGYYDDHWVALVDSECLTKLRARAVLVASGCFEQPAVFRNNDLPGVMLGSAAQRLVNLYAVKPCRRAVVLAANTDGYRLALDMRAAGVDVAAVADLRPDGEPTDLGPRVAEAGIAVHRGHTVYEATASTAVHGLDMVTLCRLDADGRVQSDHAVRVTCDGLLVSVGWAPNGALLYHAGAGFAYDSATEQLTPRQLPDGVFAAGRVNGVFELADQIADGHRAGLAAAQYLKSYDGPVPDAVPHRGPPPTHPYPIFEHPKGKNFVDLDEDLQLVDCANAVQEGYDQVELLKRYTAVGMGPSQGKLANMNAVRILARLTDRTVDQTGVTTTRPFYQPVSMSHLAGRRFHPHRHTPMHQWHVAAGAQFILAGAWLRPEYYAKARRSRDEAILAEAENVRQRVGMVDVGTLGKLHVGGPDAAAFLERTFTGKFAQQKTDTLRYCLALDESGVVVNDGVVGRLADDLFYVTATTSGVAGLFREMKRNAMLWDMQVTLLDITGQYTAMNIAGPLAAKILAPLTAVDLSAEAFPYFAVRTGRVAGARAVLLRVGFVGEQGYELHVPAAYGLHVWEALMTAGKTDGIAPFGVEAQRLLRLEKGHIIIGQDTDALSCPPEADLAWALGKDKPFYTGQRSLDIISKQSSTRTLVGFELPAGYDGPMPEECHLIIAGNDIAGRVTSIAPRSTLGRPIGLAYVRPEQAEAGTAIQIRVGGGQMVEAKVAKIPFYDPEQLRQKTPASMPPAEQTTAPSDQTPAARSPVHHHLEPLSPQWHPVGGHHAIAATLGQPGAEQLNRDVVALCDASALPKFGVAGAEAEAWLTEQNLAVPQAMFGFTSLNKDGLLVRVGSQEFFVEAGLDGAAVTALADKLDTPRPGCYRVERQEATFLLTGPRVHEALLQTCGVDLASEPEDRVVYTGVAGVSCAVLPRVQDGQRAYRLWVDYTWADYVWETLAEIAGELGGGVVGAAAFHPELHPT